MEKLKVAQSAESRFMILHHDPNTDEEKFFGGFYNETECPGTEDESFSYDMESWVERPEDGAVLFPTFKEAEDYFDIISDEKRRDCSIILYGKGEVENNILGSRWYPLKVFFAGRGFND